MRRPLSLAILAIAIGVAGCADDDLRERMAAAGVYSPSRTDGGRRGVAELGQLLFFDQELSGNRNVACASCHMPIDHAGDALELGVGQGATGVGPVRTGGPILPRNTVSPFNRSFAHSLFWDGRVERRDDGTIVAPVPLPEGIETLLEAQALLPLLDRNEMRGQDGDLDVRGDVNELASISDDAPEDVWAAVMARLMAFEEYRTLFANAFPDTAAGEHTVVHAARAIARFEMRLWELTDTPFDVFLGAEHRPPVDEALNESQRRGAELFFGDAGCDRCHNGPLLSDFAYHNIGIPAAGPGMRDGIDEGRFLVTADPLDRFAFRTPPLRNVALTAPYMHNGTSPTLGDAIRQHLSSSPVTGDDILETLDPDARPLRSLDSDEVGDIELFLESLSSRTEEGVFFGAGEPGSVPSGLAVTGPSF
jgi:cytochrome c peroxidase